MPAKSRRTPKYRHYKPKNLGVVRIEGKDHYCPGPFDSDESLAHYYALISDWRSGRLSPAGSEVSRTNPERPTSIGELILRYWGFAQAYYLKNGEPTSEQACIRSALRPPRRLYGKQSPESFTPVDLKRVRDVFIENGLSRRTVNKNVGRIRRMFKWAASENLVDASIYLALQTVDGLKKGRSAAKETGPVLPVPEDDLNAVLEEVSSVVRSLILFQLHTGCRPTEACLVRRGAIDTSGDVWCYQPDSHKTEHHDRPRRIYIGPKAQDILRPYLTRGDDKFCFSPQEAAGETRRPGQPHTRPSRRGTHYTKDSYSRAITRSCERLGLPKWTPGRLRHNQAILLRARFGLDVAQAVLGHASADVTQVYAERAYAEAENAMKEVG